MLHATAMRETREIERERETRLPSHVVSGALEYDFSYGSPLARHGVADQRKWTGGDCCGLWVHRLSSFLQFMPHLYANDVSLIDITAA